MEFETYPEFMSWVPPTVEPIIGNGLLVPQSKMIIYGPFGIGKSLLANQIAFMIANGGKLFSLFDCSSNFVWEIQLELPKAQHQKRIIKHAKACHNGNANNMGFTTEQYLKLDTDWGIAILDDVLNRHPEIRVMILDPFWKLIQGSLTDVRDVGYFTDKMDMFVNKHNIAIILVTHTRKRVTGKQGDVVDLGAEEILGSVRLPGWADTILGLRPVEPDVAELHFNKVRYGEQLLSPIKLALNRDQLKFKLV